MIEAKLTASDASGFGEYGRSVAIDGDLIAVGTFRHEAVYLYRRSGSTWRGGTSTSSWAN